MSEEVEAGEDGAEPSMEDILASIRRILSEEEEEEAAAAEAGEAAPAAEPEPVAAEEEDPFASMDAPAPEPAAEEEDPFASMDAAPAPEPEPAVEEDPFASMDAAPAPEPEPAPAPAPEPVVAAPIPEPAPTMAPAPPPAAAPPPPMQPQVSGNPFEAILDLTPDMVAASVMSHTTSTASTDILAELATAIMNRRDFTVSETNNSNMTLEGIVREMLKPILREWLDRNLPYLIERLVKKEIDAMVNRAQRMDF